jgi:hypothetical protein
MVELEVLYLHTLRAQQLVVFGTYALIVVRILLLLVLYLVS